MDWKKICKELTSILGLLGLPFSPLLLILPMIVEKLQDILPLLIESIPFRWLIVESIKDVYSLIGIPLEQLVFQDELLLAKIPEVLMVNTIFLDLSKMLFASLMAHAMFLGFRMLYLGFTPVKGVWYRVKYCFFRMWSAALGVICSNLLFKFIGDQAAKMPPREGMVCCVLIFVVLWVGSAIYLWFFSNYVDATDPVHRTFRYFLSAGLTLNVVPELLTNLVSNVLLMLAFSEMAANGASYMLGVWFLVFLLWCWLLSVVKKGLQLLTVLPYMGRKMWLSNILWPLATALVMFPLYMLYADLQREDMELFRYYMGILPFVEVWNDGSIMEFLQSDFLGFMLEFAHLWVVCLGMCALQWLSSSYFCTLLTQFFARIIILLGIMLVLMLFFQWGAEWLLYDIIAGVPCPVLLGVLLVSMVFILQPTLAVESIITAVMLLAAMEFIPTSYVIYNSDYDAATRFLLLAVGVIISGLVISLCQNLLALFDRSIRKLGRGLFPAK